MYVSQNTIYEFHKADTRIIGNYFSEEQLKRVDQGWLDPFRPSYRIVSLGNGCLVINLSSSACQLYGMSGPPHR